MRKVIMVVIVLLVNISAFSQGIEFQQGRYAEVLKMAKKKKKLVFIDIYTSWCGPCQHMAKNIFPDTSVGDFYNAHFLNLQLDAEKSEDGKKVSGQFKVTGFPTFLFVDGDGELVYRFMGGRPANLFVKEGEKAMDAFAARPELKKNAKKYEKGRRDKAFLNQYFILKDKSGLDCSDVLLDYFALLTDEEVLDSMNVERIAKITIYEERFVRRVVELICREAEKQDKDKKRFSAINKAGCTLLSACLRNAAKSDDPTAFETVLELKDRLFKAAGNHDSATAASLGGGNIYIPSDLSRMNYYTAHRQTDKFMQTYRRYMQVLLKKYTDTREEKEALEKAMDEKLKAAKDSGNEDEYDAVKRMRAVMFAFSNIDDYYISTSMIENVERYEELYAGRKDAAYIKQVADWYVFLHLMSPSVKTAVYVADKLLALDQKQLATEVLALGLEKGATAAGVEKEDVEACKIKLEELRK